MNSTPKRLWCYQRCVPHWVTGVFCPGNRRFPRYLRDLGPDRAHVRSWPTSLGLDEIYRSMSEEVRLGRTRDGYRHDRNPCRRRASPAAGFGTRFGYRVSRGGGYIWHATIVGG